MHAKLTPIYPHVFALYVQTHTNHPILVSVGVLTWYGSLGFAGQVGHHGKTIDELS